LHVAVRGRWLPRAPVPGARCPVPVPGARCPVPGAGARCLFPGARCLVDAVDVFFPPAARKEKVLKAKGPTTKLLRVRL